MSRVVYSLILFIALQDPNWCKARREDGLEGMIPTNFVVPVQVSNKKVKKKKSSKKPSRENIPITAVQLHKMP